MRLYKKFDFSCSSLPQQKVFFMSCRGNTKGPMKMAKVYKSVYIKVGSTLEEDEYNF